MSSSEVVISCKQISKTYRSRRVETQALKGVTLDIYRGERLFLVGPSGCGKTTLISIIAGILNLDQGECRVLGSDFSKLPERKRAKIRGQKIGFVFQAFNLIPTISILENVSVPLLIAGVSNKIAFERSAEVLERVGLKDRYRAKPRDLSGGQQQRVAIARSLVHKPEIIVCDEPTSALDGKTGRDVLELFRELSVEQKTTLIIVTHDSRIYDFADRIAEMNDGMIVSII